VSSRAWRSASAAQQFDETGSRDVAEFVQFAGRHVVRDAEAAAVVQVMTIHKSKGLGFDVGAITYQYPGNDSGSAGVGKGFYSKADTTEIYGALTYSVLTFKYSQSVGDFLGNLNSNGSRYFDLSATFDLGNGFSITPHVGRQLIPNQASPADYTDFSLTVSKDFGKGITASLALVTTDAKDGFYKVGSVDNLGKNGLVAGLKYSF
jgi:uncharacterized protein (TIGR02001 family)